MFYLTIAVIVLAVAIIALLVLRRRKRRLQPAAEAEVEPEPAAPAGELPEPAGALAPLTTLLETEKRRFLNAIWYRCENPDCNHSKFLDVHHIVPELEGGTHAMTNLIVLCANCQDAALSGDIPREQLSAWVRPREERFKYDISWQYR